MTGRTGFILAEDEAVKNNFAGITVNDDRNAQRPVGVHFRWPNQEIEKAYPFITVDLIGVDHALSRQHSDQYIYAYGANMANTGHIGASSGFKYWPDTTADLSTLGANGYQRTTEFIPIDLTYQVSTYCRDPRHDRQLAGILFSTGRIPFRYGYIEVPEDNTIRRFDLLGWQQSDLLDQEAANRKTIFRKVFTLQTTAELAPFQLVSLYTVSSAKPSLVVTTTTPLS